MNKAFEKILERLEKLRNNICGDIKCCECKYERRCNPIDEHYEKIFVDNAVKIVKEAAEEYNNGWILTDERFPDTDKYILLSFSNFSIPLVGRYEEDEDGSGSFYIGDEMETCLSQDLFVNAWMYLPEPPKENE